MHFGGLAIDAMVGSISWYRRRSSEDGLLSMLNRLVMDLCSKVGSTSMLGRNPKMARRQDIFVVTMKSGIALWCGNNMPRPPLLVWTCAMYFEMVGMCWVPSSSCRNFVMRSLIPSTNGLDQADQLFGLKSMGRLCITSAPSRCGNFCRVHVLNSLSRVWRSEIFVDNWVYCCCVASSCSRKNRFAKAADPTGVPSRRNPSVSSIPRDELPDFSIEYVLMEYSMFAAVEG